MAGKTPMELAQRILARKEDDVCAQCEPDCMCSEREARRIAAALVERMTPVEVSLVGRRHGYCACGQNVVTWYAFCVRCGNPLVWK